MISLHVKILFNSLNKSDLNKMKFNLKLLNVYLDYNNYDNG